MVRPGWSLASMRVRAFTHDLENAYALFGPTKPASASVFVATARYIIVDKSQDRLMMKKVGTTYLEFLDKLFEIFQRHVWISEAFADLFAVRLQS